jgi:hypothetical protein
MERAKEQRMMSVMAWTARRNPAIATGIAGVLLGSVIGTAATWTVVAAPQVRVPAAETTAGSLSNIGQYDAENMGGTPRAAGALSNIGQYDVDNMGGTPVR